MKKEKEIVFFIPNIEGGGIEKNLVLLSKYLIENNYKVKIIYHKISSNFKLKLNSKIILIKSKKLLQLNFRNQRISNSINCFIFTLLSVKLPKNSVLISMQDHPFGIIISLIKKIPSIIRIANHPVGSLKFFNSYLIYKFKLLIKLIFYHFATAIVCNSKMSADFFKKKIIIKKKIILIYNPIENFIKNKKNIKRNKNQLLTVGRIEKQKNFPGILNAIHLLSKENKKIKLIIVGSGSEKENIINQAKELKIIDRIIFKNFISPQDYYRKSGILILNSFFEGLPNVLIESMQYKIPIISTDCASGPKEILKNERYGYLIKVNDSISLAKKINYVISNYEKALKKTNYGYKSLDRFQINNQCKKYEKLIKKI